MIRVRGGGDRVIQMKAFALAFMFMNINHFCEALFNLGINKSARLHINALFSWVQIYYVLFDKQILKKCKKRPTLDTSDTDDQKVDSLKRQDKLSWRHCCQVIERKRNRLRNNICKSIYPLFLGGHYYLLWNNALIVDSETVNTETKKIPVVSYIVIYAFNCICFSKIAHF